MKFFYEWKVTQTGNQLVCRTVSSRSKNSNLDHCHMVKEGAGQVMTHHKRSGKVRKDWRSQAGSRKRKKERREYQALSQKYIQLFKYHDPNIQNWNRNILFLGNKYIQYSYSVNKMECKFDAYSGCIWSIFRKYLVYIRIFGTEYSIFKYEYSISLSQIYLVFVFAQNLYYEYIRIHIQAII